MLFFYLSLIDNEEDKSKFEELYMAYRKPMTHYVTKFMGKSDFAEDIVHEAFMRIINHIDGVEDIDSHKTKSFIVTIVRNICIDYLRAEKKNDHISYDEEYDIYYQPSKKIQYNLEEIEFSALVDKIKELPKIYSDVLMLKFYYGYNDREIADMLGLAYPTVRKRIARARDLLSYSLKEWRI